MAEVMRVIDDPVLLEGVQYTAQVCGRRNRHLWEGWIEFVADNGSAVRRTPRETTQPDRDALVYWSQGLSETYLEGALARTLPKVTVAVRELQKPYFEEPAVSQIVHETESQPPGDVGRAVLHPFFAAAPGEDVLRSELSALSDRHLRNIIRAYNLANPTLDLEALTARELTELIVAAVQPA